MDVNVTIIAGAGVQGEGERGIEREGRWEGERGTDRLGRRDKIRK